MENSSIVYYHYICNIKVLVKGMVEIVKKSFYDLFKDFRLK